MLFAKRTYAFSEKDTSFFHESIQVVVCLIEIIYNLSEPLV